MTSDNKTMTAPKVELTEHEQRVAAALPTKPYPAATDEVGGTYDAGEYTDHTSPATQDLVYNLRLRDGKRPTYRSIVATLGMQTPHHGQLAAEAAGKRAKAAEYRRRDGAYNTLPLGGVALAVDVLADQAAKQAARKAPAKAKAS